MGPLPRFPLPGLLVVRVMLTLTALDSLLVGLWAVLRPQDVFAWLQMPELPPEGPHDRLLLWRVLGGINLVHAGFLGILVWRPAELGPLALASLMGRLLGCGVWLFAWGTDRVDLPDGPCLILAAHDAIGALVLVVFLLAWWWAWRRLAPLSPGGEQKK